MKRQHEQVGAVQASSDPDAGTSLRRQGFLVLGMHRSGTSSVAGTLVKLGVAPPKTLLGATSGNERGHWESSVLIAFHDELLASAGSRWDDWRQFNENWYDTPIAESFKTRAKQLLSEEFGDAAAFVLKDPRICRFARFWIGIFQEEGIEANALLPLRSPLEVAQSHQNRDGFSLRKGLLLWLRHVLDAERTSRDIPRVIFEWSRFLGDWRASVDQIAETLGARWPALTDISAAEIERFISSDLKHQQVPEDDLAHHPALHDWVLEAYKALRDLSQEPSSKVAQGKLDAVADRFEQGAALFGAAFAEMELTYTESINGMHALEAERNTAHAAALHEVLTEKADMQLQIAALNSSDAALKDIAAENESLRTYVDELNSKLLKSNDEKNAAMTRVQMISSEVEKQNKDLSDIISDYFTTSLTSKDSTNDSLNENTYTVNCVIAEIKKILLNNKQLIEEANSKVDREIAEKELLTNSIIELDRASMNLSSEKEAALLRLEEAERTRRSLEDELSLLREQLNLFQSKFNSLRSHPFRSAFRWLTGSAI